MSDDCANMPFLTFAEMAEDVACSVSKCFERSDAYKEEIFKLVNDYLWTAFYRGYNTSSHGAGRK